MLTGTDTSPKEIVAVAIERAGMGEREEGSGRREAGGGKRERKKLVRKTLGIIVWRDHKNN